MISLVWFSFLTECLTSILYSAENLDSDLHLILYFVTGAMWKPFQLGRGIPITRTTDLGQLRPMGMPGSRGKCKTETAST